MKFFIPSALSFLPVCTVLTVFVLTAGEISHSPLLSGRSWLDSHQTISSFLEENVSTLAPQKYVVQRKLRNEFHRRAFTGILFDASNGDAMTALFGFIKLKLTMEYSIVYLYRVFSVGGWPLPDYYGFPVDPWNKEWWLKR